jgi:hypothetical protein
VHLLELDPAPKNVGGDLYIAISALRTVYWSLREAANFLGGVHSESHLSLLPEKIYSSVSPSGARRLVTRYVRGYLWCEWSGL